MRNATKKVAKKAAVKKASAPAKVRVRMYRPGLGDCFLLTFPQAGREHHVLIDCGVFIGTAGQKDRLTRIATHIRQTTGDQLQALVATHEHWDHVAGFFFAKDEFAKLKTNEVWAAWTEDPTQTIATEKKQQQNAMAEALNLAVTRLMVSESPYDRECGVAATRVMDFAAAKFSKQSDAGMTFVTDRRKPGEPFLKPGDVFERDWLPGGLRIYVLAPPMDRAALRQERTPHGEGFKDDKKDGTAFAWASAVMGAAGGREETELAERLRPFDVSLAWPETEVLRGQEFGELGRRYREDAARRIDNDWLQSAASLALQLDNSINNTSLVLAFELVQSGKVLLFVGDSELESWKSWQNLVFTLADKSKVQAQDLLARTVFYKVGHHGSGNATLRAGLEAMTSPDLVAAVPTDSAFARDKQGWDMPAAKLGPALQERARGRVIYADPGQNPIREENPAKLDPPSWDLFRRDIDASNELYVDYHLPV